MEEKEHLLSEIQQNKIRLEITTRKSEITFNVIQHIRCSQLIPKLKSPFRSRGATFYVRPQALNGEMMYLQLYKIQHVKAQ
jgi:hypothetical protein